MFDSNQIIDRIKAMIDTKESKNDILLKICNLLKQEVYHYDWVGFYLPDKELTQLILGPYVGKSTDHTHIPWGKGVCGQVAENKKTMIVQDVNKMDNYIACSMNVQSEIVVPVLIDGEFVAEIDIDSHSPAPFKQEDKELLESIAALLISLF